MPDCPSLSLGEIEAAARRLEGEVVTTPLVENWKLNRKLKARVLLKAEVLQRTGSFKYRGAFHRLSLLTSRERKRGVVAFSSGNHGQAVAAAAARLGMPATIVMPKDAPSIKIARTREFGAEVVLYDRMREDRRAIAERLAQEREQVIVPPYDDLRVMAGQGTVGLELVRQATHAAKGLDLVLVPCGGGGLIAGVSTAVTALSPGTEIVAVEPVGFDDTGRSLAAGHPLSNAATAESLCDSLLTPRPGVLTFPINRRRVRYGVAVADDAVKAAMAFAFSELKLVVEPGGAVALAALLFGNLDLENKTVVAVLSGGNVDPSVFCSALTCSRGQVGIIA